MYAAYDYTAQSGQEHSLVRGEKLVQVGVANQGWATVKKTVNGVEQSLFVPASYITLHKM